MSSLWSFSSLHRRCIFVSFRTIRNLTLVRINGRLQSILAIVISRLFFRYFSSSCRNSNSSKLLYFLLFASFLLFLFITELQIKIKRLLQLKFVKARIHWLRFFIRCVTFCNIGRIAGALPTQIIYCSGCSCRTNCSNTTADSYVMADLHVISRCYHANTSFRVQGMILTTILNALSNIFIRICNYNVFRTIAKQTLLISFIFIAGKCEIFANIAS